MDAPAGSRPDLCFGKDTTGRLRRTAASHRIGLKWTFDCSTLNVSAMNATDDLRRRSKVKRNVRPRPSRVTCSAPDRRRPAPMPLAFYCHHPEGMVENSPAFQRRDGLERESSPAGTAETGRVSRPSGTYPSRTSNPALKRRAIIVCPSGTETDLCTPNPSVIRTPPLRGEHNMIVPSRISALLCVYLFLPSAHASRLRAQPTDSVSVLKISADQVAARVSPRLYGLMTEEINYSYDAGLYAERVR